MCILVVYTEHCEHQQSRNSFNRQFSQVVTLDLLLLNLWTACLLTFGNFVPPLTPLLSTDCGHNSPEAYIPSTKQSIVSGFS